MQCPNCQSQDVYLCSAASKQGTTTSTTRHRHFEDDATERVCGEHRATEGLGRRIYLSARRRRGLFVPEGRVAGP